LIPNKREASKNHSGYEQFVLFTVRLERTDHGGDGRKPELTGGGLVRSLEGWSAVKSMRKEGAVLARDLICYWATSKLGITQAWLSKKFRLSQSGSESLRGKRV